MANCMGPSFPSISGEFQYDGSGGSRGAAGGLIAIYRIG
jgi:hypothetical protein